MSRSDLPIFRRYWPGPALEHDRASLRRDFPAEPCALAPPDPRPSRRRNGVARAGGGWPKVLYVSDSLGAPIHPRGIFNYSVALVEMLRAENARVDLIVEGANGFGLEGPLRRFADSAPEAVNTVRLSEVHRYFREGRLGFYWGARGRRWPLAAWQALRERMRGGGMVKVRNDPAQVDFVPPESEHLALFDHLIVKPGFYSASISRANLGLAPPVLDAAGYDLVVIDTPHFLGLRGIAPEQAWTIVHDLIPLRDPTTHASWRNLFLRKLGATLALRANLVFVSHYTRSQFRAAFARHEAAGEYVLYPAIRRKLADPAAPAAPEPSAASAPKRGRRRSLHGGRPTPAGFDPALPYFVTAVSDEARKNVGALVQAFRRSLRGKANMIILGQIETGRFDARGDANVHFPGYVSDAEKVAYFRGSRGLVFASHSEGFGIPIVEGAVLGLPVLCSDIAVFREVAGRDALYFDPRDPASLAAAVEETLSDPAAAGLRAAALRRSVLARFSQEAVGVEVRAALEDLGLAAEA